MSGRSYTLKEMSTIVDYIKANNLYGETKGRKMWTDFANTSLTTRTWQSLKETFLKRILPDIHNPYYGLSRNDIISFKQGYDVEQKKTNKLEIHTISDESSSNENQNVNKEASTSRNKDQVNSTGEDPKASKVDAHSRESTETLVLEQCYQTPEDIQRALESPRTDETLVDDNKTQNKCLRDFITYAEPLTPILQEVLHDFATDSEPELQIAENIPDAEEPANKSSQPNVPDENGGIENSNENGIEKQIDKQATDDVVNSDNIENITNISDNNDSNNQKENQNNSDNVNKTSEITNTESDIISINMNNNIKDNISKEVCEIEKMETQNSHSTPDTLLPGNQEALDNTNKEISKSSPARNNKLKLGRKRANSDNQSTLSEKKKKINKQKSISEAGSSTEDKQIDFKLPSPIKNKPQKEIIKPNISKSLEKINDTDNKEKNETHNHVEKDCSPSQLNPCLNSVNLYEEQFNITKYIDSDSSDDTIKIDKKDDKIQKTTENGREVVLLHSHSDTDDNIEPEQVSMKNENEREIKKSKKIENQKVRTISNSNLQRNKALANVFGFSSGAAASRKRKLSTRKPSFSQLSHNNDVDSSEWTSEEEYVSSPRARKTRCTRKYIKPRSSRILSLEDEGGLVVVHDNRIYPVVKDGKLVKNYLMLTRDSDSEEDSDYWKNKYEEEKRKTEELKRLLDKSKENENKTRETSPLLPIPTVSKSTGQTPTTSKDANTNRASTSSEHSMDRKTPEKTLKIKFTKNNEELLVEGHWSHIHPVLANVVQLFQKDGDAKDVSEEVQTHKDLDIRKECNDKIDDEIFSTVSSAVSEDVHEKVAKLESEIFKEIEEMDKEQQSENNAEETQVTKRRGRPRKSEATEDKQQSPSISATSPSKSTASRTSLRSKSKTTVKSDEPPAQQPENEAAKRKTRTPRKLQDIATTSHEGSRVKPEKSNTRKSKIVDDNEKDSDVRYMLPPETKRRNMKSKSNTTGKRMYPIPKIFCSVGGETVGAFEYTNIKVQPSVDPSLTSPHRTLCQDCGYTFF